MSDGTTEATEAEAAKAEAPGTAATTPDGTNGTVGTPGAPGAPGTEQAKPTPTLLLTRSPGPAELDPDRARRRRRTLEITLGIAVPLLLLLWWQLAVQQKWIDSRIYPAPQTILEDGWKRLVDGKLWPDIWATLKRVVPGFLLGSLAGYVVGLLTGSIPLVRAALEPMLDALYVVPKLALLPIFLLIFGLGETPQIMLVAVTVFFLIWIQTMAAVLAVPEGYREAATVFGASQWQMYRHILIPASLPPVVVGLRLASGMAVLVIVASEGLASPNNDGLGYLIFNAKNIFDQKAMYVGIITVAVVGVLFSELVRLIGRLLTPWAPDRRGPGGS
ncbi:ABC transporter permease [Yinghuangia seranimata]|uniref:ABC transporter permease n=1 Tax=Yinghuangia seranimata TaxID=408067 RepID=UPI00248B70CC|nr:ABC transporter permease [Yinghuangia seranimata]MDI2128044.1 ABC transporter permease [Yinghuangia seranimata]